MLASIAASPSLACKGPDVLVVDDFTEPTAPWRWDEEDDERGTFTIGDGKLTLQPKEWSPRKTFFPHTWYEGDVFPGGDLCVDIAVRGDQDILGGVFLTGTNLN